MRSLALATGIATACMGTTAWAAPTPGNKIKGKGGNVGVGVSLGDPMGGSAKFFLHPNHALQLDLGWAPLHHGHGRLGLDYLWHPGTFVSNGIMDFLPYLGVGVGLAFWAGHCYGGYYHHHHHGYCDGHGGAAMFIRAPILGLGFHWKKVPIDTMLEGSWSPYVVLPDLPHGDVSFKVRYYF